MKIAFVYNAVYPIKGGAEKKIYETDNVNVV